MRGNPQALFGKRPAERTRPRAPRRRSTSLGGRPSGKGPSSPEVNAEPRRAAHPTTAHQAKIFGGEHDPGHALPVAYLARGGGCSRPAGCDVVQQRAGARSRPVPVGCSDEPGSAVSLRLLCLIFVRLCGRLVPAQCGGRPPVRRRRRARSSSADGITPCLPGLPGPSPAWFRWPPRSRVRLR